MDNRPIGVFDSGLGGLTAVLELKKLLPNENIIYFGDTSRVPYGNRSRETIIKYAAQDIEFLLEKDVKLLIAACGTVSAVLPEYAEGCLPVPLLKVAEHAAAAAVKATKNKIIGVIGTAATIRSGIYAEKIKSIDEEITVIEQACPLFVPLVENGYFNAGNPVALLIAKEYLQPLAAAGADTLILGCTHYPLLSVVIDEVLDSKVTLINSGQETARYAKLLLEREDMLSTYTQKGNTEYFVSDAPDDFAKNASVFLGEFVKPQASIVKIEQFDAYIFD